VDGSEAYYWPNPIADLQAIRRALKPGATAIIIACK